MLWVVWLPGSHKYDEPALAVRVTEPPEGMFSDPLGVMVAVGSELTVTLVADEVAEHPEALVTLTVYEPPVVTLMVCVVWLPGDHR